MNKQKVFAALADPTRRQVLEMLSSGKIKTPTEIADEFSMTRQGISKHLSILEDAGLVTAEKVGRERRYSFRPEPLEETISWIQAVNANWEARLGRLYAHLMADRDAGDQGT